MTLVKEIELFKIDSNAINGAISVRVDAVVREDGNEISRIPHRHSIVPLSSKKNSDGTWTHDDTDLTNEHERVKAIANTLWTDEVKENFRMIVESQVL